MQATVRVPENVGGSAKEGIYREITRARLHRGTPPQQSGGKRQRSCSDQRPNEAGAQVADEAPCWQISL